VLSERTKNSTLCYLLSIFFNNVVSLRSYGEFMQSFLIMSFEFGNIHLSIYLLHKKLKIDLIGDLIVR
jgi:hypothetical protein